MRLIAVVLLSLVIAYWGGYAVYLLFRPEGSPGATLGVLLGGICLAIGALYALATWGVATHRRGLHIAAIVLTALGVASVFVGRTADVWILATVNVIALVLLTQSIPRPVGK